MRSFFQILLPAGLVIFTAGWAASDEPPQVQSFVDYCGFVGANLTDTHWLGLFCRNNMTDIYGYNYTWIDLDFCLGNNGSQLIAYEGGNFSTSCTDCTIHSSRQPKKSLLLTCSCEDDNWELVESSIELNSTLYDYNGSAGCFNHLGNKSWLTTTCEAA